MYEACVAFTTLTFLEILLGIDNVIFLSLLTSRVKHQIYTRIIGTSLALVLRAFILYFILLMTKINIALFGNLLIKNFLFIGGGLFLVFESSKQLFFFTENQRTACDNDRLTFKTVIGKIILIDLVFSIDSIMAAITLTSNFILIISAFAIAMVIMLLCSTYLVRILEKYLSIKILALVFIFFIGIVLFCEGINIIIPRNYVYVSLAFALLVEIVQLFITQKDVKGL